MICSTSWPSSEIIYTISWPGSETICTTSWPGFETASLYYFMTYFSIFPDLVLRQATQVPTLVILPTLILTIHYRRQRSWGKVIFSQVSVILLTGGVYLSACWDTKPPSPRSRHPREQTIPLGPDTPGSRHPLGADTPQSRPPCRRACWDIRSTRGRYASTGMQSR